MFYAVKPNFFVLENVCFMNFNILYYFLYLFKPKYKQ